MKEFRDRAYNLPRLPRPFYQADAAVHWTLTLFDRATGWLDEPFHAGFRELVLHSVIREGLLCPAYCLMPDHIHLVWMGLRPDSDQLNGMAFLRTHLEPALAPAKFQPQAHDHVLRKNERNRDAFRSSIAYDLHNPVNKGLVRKPEDWPFSGCILPGYPAMHPLNDSFWGVFWKIYRGQRDPRCDEHVLPSLR